MCSYGVAVPTKVILGNIKKMNREHKGVVGLIIMKNSTRRGHSLVAERDYREGRVPIPRTRY